MNAETELSFLTQSYLFFKITRQLVQVVWCTLRNGDKEKIPLLELHPDRNMYV